MCIILGGRSQYITPFSREPREPWAFPRHHARARGFAAKRIKPRRLAADKYPVTLTYLLDATARRKREFLGRRDGNESPTGGRFSARPSLPSPATPFREGSFLRPKLRGSGPATLPVSASYPGHPPLLLPPKRMLHDSSRNPVFIKSEIRNPKQIHPFQMGFSFQISGFRICFGFRISDFRFGQ